MKAKGLPQEHNNFHRIAQSGEECTNQGATAHASVNTLPSTQASIYIAKVNHDRLLSRCPLAESINFLGISGTMTAREK